MSIAEKLTTIAENEQRVYEAGLNKGWADCYDQAYEEGWMSGLEEGKLELLDESKYMHPTISGNIISVNDASPIEHSLGVKLTNKNLIDIPNLENIKGDGTVVTLYDSIKKINCGGKDTFISCKPIINEEISISENGNLIYANITFENGFVGNYALYAMRTSGTIDFGTFVPSATNGDIIAMKIIKHGRWTGGNLSITNIQLEFGTTATEYTPYITDFTDVEVTRCGKNLFNSSNNKYKGASVVKENENGRITVSQNNKSIWVSANFPLPNSLVGKTVTISAKVSTSGENFGGLRIMWVATNGGATGNHIISRCDVSGTNQDVSVSGVIPPRPAEEYNQLCLLLYSNTEATLNSGVEYTTTYSNIQIEVGNTATEYEPYNEQTANSNADGTVEGLTSISPNMTLYADNNGAIINCQYYRDIDRYIDNLIGNVVLSGGE